MTRILHLTKRFTGTPGGDATAVRGLAIHQRAGGHHVTILTSNCRAISPGRGVEKFGLVISDADIDRVNLRRVASLLALLVTSFFRLRRERPDVIHAHTVDMGAAVSPAARALGIPLVLTLHGTSIGAPALSARKQWLERQLVNVARYDAIFCVTPDALPLLQGLSKRPAQYLPNAVDLDEFRAGEYPPADAPLLFIGRLEAVKGVDVLLRALAEVRGGGWPLRLRLAGGGSLQSQLEQQARELGIDEAVEFLGRCSPEQIVQELHRCAALVLPSRYEGFPIVLLEAWASARPVISTTVGAVPDVCTDGVDALLVPAGNVRALAGALIRLAGDTSFAAALGRAGRLAVQAHYTPDAVAQEVEQVYADLRGLAPAPEVTAS